MKKLLGILVLGLLRQDDCKNIKNLKFKDFLDFNEKIKYIEPEQAVELILVK